MLAIELHSSSAYFLQVQAISQGFASVHLCAITEMTCVESVSVAPDREVGPIKQCPTGGSSSHGFYSFQNYAAAVSTTLQLGSLKIPFFFFPQVDN